jgi:hypothetical protein
LVVGLLFLTIIAVMISGRLRWARLVTRMRKMKNRPTDDITADNLK